MAPSESVLPEGLLPEDLAAMRDQLLADGFHVVELVYNRENFGNAIMALERRGLIVRATRDRSQWLLSLSGPWGGAGFDPEIVRAYIDHDDPEVQPTPRADQIRFILERLLEVETAGAAEGPALQDKLRRINARTLEAYRKLPPDQKKMIPRD